MSRATEAVERSLAAISRTEDALQAWVWLDPDLARQAAGQAVPGLPLEGLTVGIKDIFDVRGMPTVAGFAPYERRGPARQDAAAVASLRAAGALVIGKTATTQFASSDPAPTRNPWHPGRTPGGSSAGSAAAVAAGHVDLAFGSQTSGSTLRPAAFCGVIGFKPTFDWAPRAGMLPLANTLDHVGLIGGSIDVLERAWRVVVQEPVGPAPATQRALSPRLAIWTDAATRSSPPMQAGFQAAVNLLDAPGTSPVDAPLVPSYDDIWAIQQTILASEAAAAHRRLIRAHADAYAPRIRATVEVGQAIPAWAYAEAQALRDEFRDRIAIAWASFDAILLPTTSTTAPSLETTGDPLLQAAATLFGFPSISLPAGLDADGLPWGLQVIVPRRGGDAQLLAIARWIQNRLPSPPAPPGS